LPQENERVKPGLGMLAVCKITDMRK